MLVIDPREDVCVRHCCVDLLIEFASAALRLLGPTRESSLQIAQRERFRRAGKSLKVWSDPTCSEETESANETRQMTVK